MLKLTVAEYLLLHSLDVDFISYMTYDVFPPALPRGAAEGLVESDCTWRPLKVVTSHSLCELLSPGSLLRFLHLGCNSVCLPGKCILTT